MSVDQLEHEQIFPRAGWVEHDPVEIWENTREVIGRRLARANLTARDIAAVGITNQRETAVVWDRHTGEPVYNAIVWQDTRTQKIVDALAADGGPGRYKDARPAAGDVLLRAQDRVDPRPRRRRPGARRGRRPALRHHRHVGAVEPHRRAENGGVHVTDVTNASRTMLMDLATLAWDESIAADLAIPTSMLPEIRSSSEVYGECKPRACSTASRSRASSATSRRRPSGRPA